MPRAAHPPSVPSVPSVLPAHPDSPGGPSRTRTPARLARPLALAPAAAAFRWEITQPLEQCGRLTVNWCVVQLSRRARRGICGNWTQG